MDSKIEEEILAILENEESGQLNANQLAEKYRKRYGKDFNYRSLGYKKLGNLLDQGAANGRWLVCRLQRRGSQPGAMIVYLSERKVEIKEINDDKDAVVLGYYLYAKPRWNISAREATVAWKRALAHDWHLCGRIRVACEGVNVSLTGTEAHVHGYIDALQSGHTLWSDTKFQIEICTPAARWRRLSVWTSDELCGLGLKSTQDQCALDEIGPGIKLEPLEFDARLRSSDRKAVLIDVRNFYESQIGRFQPRNTNIQCLDPDTRTFYEFQQWIDDHLQELKETPDIYMVCTGGVRCERASALLKSKLDSFQDNQVYHLAGGIVNYCKTLTQYPQRENLFKGRNYVFDRRARHGEHPAVGAASSSIEESSNFGSCCLCKAKWDSYQAQSRCSICRCLLLVCPSCEQERQGRLLLLRCHKCYE